jgi:glycosyltransferase involved in cell wall biosynthesis
MPSVTSALGLSQPSASRSGIQMLEALARGRSVIALDHQGARVPLTDEVGIRVAVGDATATVAGLAAAIQRLVDDPDRRRRMASGAIELARQHTWQGKARTVTDIYELLT